MGMELLVFTAVVGADAFLQTARASSFRDTCESLGGFYFVRGATWAPWRTEALVNALAVFVYFSLGETWPPLRTETHVNALAVFTSFGALHGPP